MQTLDSKGHAKTTPGIPRGVIVTFSGAAVPAGWVLCDGTNQTPDLRDRFIVGNASVGLGTASGTVSATAALTHSGMAVAAHSAHAVGQAGAHSGHTVGQAGAHSSHVVTQAGDHGIHALNATHTHDAHATQASAAGGQTVMTGPSVHNAQGAHTHGLETHAHTGAALDAHSAHTGAALDAHSAHTGAALDGHSAHSVTQPSSHGILKHYLLAYIMKT